MFSNVNNNLEQVGNSVISAGTGVTLVAQDHTTQIISVVIQLLTIWMMYIKNKSTNSQSE